MEQTLSPIEQDFLNAALPHIEGLESQKWIGRFRVDFVVQNKRLIIELDGHEFHSTREQRTADTVRQRELQHLGYTVIRFTGSEIHADVKACVDETVELLDSLPEQKEPLPTRERVRYCIRMKEVITHLLDKFGRDTSERYFALQLSLKGHDDLFIERQDKLVTIAHFYMPQESVEIPDPLVHFVVARRGPEDYEEWAPIKLRQVFSGKDFAKVNEDDKVVITDFNAQHQVAEFSENWAQVIRLQGWLKDAEEVA